MIIKTIFMILALLAGGGIGYFVVTKYILWAKETWVKISCSAVLALLEGLLIYAEIAYFTKVIHQ